MSVRTLSGAGRSLLICEDNQSPSSSAIFQRHKHQVLWPCVIRRRTNDFPILPLLNHVCTPSRGPSNHKQRRKQIDRNPHLVIGNRAVPIQVRKHPLSIVHHALDTIGNREQSHIATSRRQPASHFLYNFAELGRASCRERG